MTCIVGMTTAAGVTLGADSLGSNGRDRHARTDPKVFTLSESVAIGFTWSYRMGQILRYHLALPSITIDEYEWAVKELIPAARMALKEHGYAKTTDGRDEGGQFLLAVRGRLFSVGSDFQVSESAHPFSACGSGEDYAIGTLYALRDSDLDTRGRLTRALECAEEFATSVRGPFAFVETRA